jgi:hypothetical protein
MEYKHENMKNIIERNIFVFWTGNNIMSETRKKCLDDIQINSKCNVILITPDNLNEYILPNEPLHKAYNFLHFTHKADYLRTYFMNFHGGGYSDIKMSGKPWTQHFVDILQDDNIYINGYPEFAGGVAPNMPRNIYNELIGNGSYICKPMTPLTQEWYSEMLLLLDLKLDRLITYHNTLPSNPEESILSRGNSTYPIRWTEMLGNIFHKVCYKYKGNLLRTLHRFSFEKYR